jgi:hypothetical protein
VSDEDPALVVTVGQPKVEEEDVIAPPPPVKQAEVDKSDQIKMMITSALGGLEGKKRKLKLNVSSNCLVSRLIRKWIEALKSEVQIEPNAIDLFRRNGVAMDRSKILSEALSGEVCEEERYHVEAKVRVNETIASPKRRRESTSQEVEVMYWKQMQTAEAEGIAADLLAEEEESCGSFVDDEEALAIALSLSEET